MGFLDWFRPRRDIEVASPFADGSHLERLTITELFPGLDIDNLPITRDTAMQIPALSRARTILTSGVARMRLLAHDATGPLKPQPDVARQPDPGHPANHTWTWIVDELLFHGSAYLYVLDEDQHGRALRFRVLPQHRIDFDEAGQPVGYRGLRMPNRWVRIDGPHEGILNFGAPSIRAAHSIEVAYRNAAHNPVPAIDLHQTTPNPQLTPEQRQELIAAWSAARRGKNGAVAYTSSNIEAKPIGQAAEQLLIAARNAAAVDMARLVGLPAWAVDAQVSGSSLTYSNIVDRNRELVDIGFAPFMAAIESRLSMDDVLEHGRWAHFSTNEWLRGDLKARAEAYQAAKEAGLMTEEQIADTERGVPLEG